MASEESPRVLRLTFEFRVPIGLRVNIRGERMRAAAEAFTSAVQALASQVFPWASEMRVRHEWSYAWYDHEPDPIELPATEKNTPK
ncbi:hypothetical protein [Streptomyces sp. SP18BB07]|uniref:hypothetical protein n=1 Tax=Streptomyces sp. SP18BB07 TaxID=3002522 RepID=UPI002E7971AD|nr:hypothetical protein [Streptomyces sp. SP18BB07]MEE1764382.1 hypothetical protein [Streptomyces sp. SP18BB07]